MNRPDKLFVLGLTGPTGAGKSAVAGMLAAAGLPVLDADKIAREVVEPGSPCLAALARAFSPDILRPVGTLDRKRLAALAFQDDASAKKLSAVTHPAIIARSLARLQEWEAAGCRAAVVDAPLLYESGMDAICGLVAAVIAPEDLRLKRILARDGITEQEARRRMAVQPDEAFYRAKGARLLVNDGDLAALRRQADALLACINHRT